MARRKQDTGPEVILVNVFYEDGTQSSNRKVTRAELSGFDDAGDIRRAIEAQDREIGAKSGRPRAPIKSIARVGKR